MLFTSRALFEEGVEDSVYIDVGGDNAVDLDDIEDLIDGNVANEDEIEQAQDAEFDFDGSADAVTEAYAIMYETEYNWGQLMECIGMYELNEAVRGRTPILEAVDVKGFIEKAKDMIRRIVEKVASICKSAIIKLVQNEKVMKAFIGKKKEAIEKGFNIIKSGGSSRKNMKDFIGYEFNLVEGASVLNKVLPIKDVRLDGSTRTFKGIDGDSDSDIEEAVNRYRGKFVGESSVTLGEFREKLYEFYRGKNQVMIKLQDYRWILSSIRKNKVKDVQVVYKQFEKDANEHIKELNDAKKKAERDSDEFKGLVGKIKFYKSAKNAASVAMSVYISCCLSELAQNLKICRKLAAIGGDKKATMGGTSAEAVDESSLFRYVDLI